MLQEFLLFFYLEEKKEERDRERQRDRAGEERRGEGEMYERVKELRRGIIINAAVLQD